MTYLLLQLDVIGNWLVWLVEILPVTWISCMKTHPVHLVGMEVWFGVEVVGVTAEVLLEQRPWRSWRR
jgi:hypothetical protein